MVTVELEHVIVTTGIFSRQLIDDSLNFLFVFVGFPQEQLSLKGETSSFRLNGQNASR